MGHVKKQFTEPSVFPDFAWVAVTDTVQTETQTPTSTCAGSVPFILKGRSVGTDLCEADKD